MQLFIDSADPIEIEDAYRLGLISGVTTNPSLAAKSSQDYPKDIEKILRLIHGPVSIETVATTYEGMVAEGTALSRLNKHVVVKIPCVSEGFMAAKKLSSHNIAVNMTLCFTLNQALLAANAGVLFVSPFLGRLNEIERNSGFELLKKIKQAYSNYNIKTKILAASIRQAEDIETAALIGADICTVPYNILIGLSAHPLTKKGLDKFLTDWKGSGLSLPV